MPDRLSAARFYAILDTAYVSRAQWRGMAVALIAGGADLVQVRAKRETPAERGALVREVLPLYDTSPVGPDLASEPFPPDRPAPHDGRRAPIFIINDDVELCARTPGAGLHIGQDDMPPAAARARIGADRVLGLSTHSWAQAQAAMALPAGVLSYFCVGPIFATQTKPDYTPVGLELIRQVAAARPTLPWFVIGGVSRANVAAVVAAGASRVVVVSEVLLAADPAGIVRTIRSNFLISPTGPGR